MTDIIHVCNFCGILDTHLDVTKGEALIQGSVGQISNICYECVKHVIDVSRHSYVTDETCETYYNLVKASLQ